MSLENFLVLNKMSVGDEMGQLFLLRPSDIFFSKTTIKSTLTAGDSIHLLLDQLGSGDRLCDRDWFPLEVAKDKTSGRWYSMNNRRLYIAKVLEKLGRLKNVQVMTFENR